jgi:hypothetical protein
MIKRIKEGKEMPYILWVLDGDDRQWKMYKGVNDAKQFIKDHDYDEFLDELNAQAYPNGTYYNNYIDWIVIPAGEEPRKFDTHKFYNSIKYESVKRNRLSRKNVMIEWTNRNYIITIGALQSVCISNMKVEIYDSYSEEVVWDGYFNDALKTYPELADCEVLHLQASGSQSLSIETFVGGQFEFDPAW